MQKKCHTKEGSVTVDVGLVELDRGESRLLDGSRGWSRGCGVWVVVIVVISESGFVGRNGVGMM